MLVAEDRRLFEESLRSVDPTAALSDAVRRLHKASGKGRQEILAELEEFRDVLREQNRDRDEDVVLEVMDFLVGWSSPHMSLVDEISAHSAKRGAAEDGQREGKAAAASESRHHAVPQPKFRFVSPGTTGVMVDRRQAAFLRDQFFPPITAISEPTIAVLNLTGVFPSPGFLQDLILPLAQRIRGGLYSQLKLFVITHDVGVADFLSYLAKEQDLALFVVAPSDSASPLSEALSSACPLGDLTSTEKTTLNILVQLGGTVTASEFARNVGIEATAAGNRLVNLTQKGFLFRFEQPQREGHLYVDPRALAFGR